MSTGSAVVIGLLLVGVAFFLMRTRAGADVRKAVAGSPKVMGPPPPAPPPSTRPDDGMGVVDQLVKMYDGVSEQVGYDLCMQRVGNRAMCEQAKNLKYANPITATVHLGKLAYDKVASWF